MGGSTVVNDDFYVGYETGIPAVARPRVRGAVATALATSLIVGLTVVVSQSPLPAARFDSGAETAFSGVVRLDPEPALDTDSGRILLVAPGKRGAASLVRDFVNRRVALKGALIERGGLRLLEVVPAAITAASGAAAGGAAGSLTDVGDVVLTGEIVDAKCYAGVMNPGEGTVHRDCARACLRGGLPAMFAVRTPDGRDVLFALESTDGAALGEAVADVAGRQITLAGRAFTALHGRRILRIDPRALEPH